MIVEPPVIVLAYRFGHSIPWSDVPYSWHLQPVAWRVVPSLDHSPEARALLWISLVGADDGIIHAQRGMTLSPCFTRALHDAIRAQALTAFDAEECTTAISQGLSQFSEYCRPVVAGRGTNHGQRVATWICERRSHNSQMLRIRSEGLRPS